MQLRTPLPLKALLLLAPALVSLPLLSAADTPDFTELSLSELMQIRVTSVSRKEEMLSFAPASISVITGEEVERLGATTLASALRLSPGMQVARIDAHEYAVSSRGFNDLYSNKLLVLVDGRTIYNQLFSGVFWNQNSVFLSDLNHIEVIRGPGSTQWGANAVNGVINVSSKDSRDTLGGLLHIVAGDQTQAMVEARQGWRFNQNTTARFYLKHQEESDYGIAELGASTGWRAQLAGFRLDWHKQSEASLTWITEARRTLVGNNASIPSFSPPYMSEQHETYRVGSYMSLLKWTQSLGENSTLSVQTYLDRSDRTALKFGEDRTIFDIDCQLLTHPLPGHEVILGTGFRNDSDRLTPSIAYDYSIVSDSAKIFSTFIQDEITLVPDLLKLSAGIKFEKGSLFGWEPQPSIRLVYTPSALHTFWASCTRAARTPSRSERDLRMFHTVIPPREQIPLPTAVFLSGQPGFKTEHLWAYELGYRTQPLRELSFDASLFYNSYTDLRDINATPTGIDSHLGEHYTLDSFFLNEMKGYTYGAELSVKWRPLKGLRFDACFSTIRYNLEDSTPILPYPAAATEGTTPRYQSSLKVSWTFAKHFDLDLFYSYRSQLNFHNIPAYSGLDARLAWSPTETLSLAVSGMDLFDPEHPEFGAYFLSGPVRQIARSYHLSATLHF